MDRQTTKLIDLIDGQEGLTSAAVVSSPRIGADLAAAVCAVTTSSAGPYPRARNRVGGSMKADTDRRPQTCAS